MSAKPTPHALMLRDTVVDLQLYLAERPGETDFDKGYSMGLAHAIETLRHQCEAFGLRDDLGWMEPDGTKWLR
jgi:hypothetical protein